jgi:ornithine cyclodeaminase/alanine dehydrogenase-like protein (mu-crystallin family)
MTSHSTEERSVIEFIDADAVHEMLSFETLIPALEEAHKGKTPRYDRHLMEEPRSDGPPDIFINLPAWQPGEGIGVKLVTSFPGNKQERGIPTVNAIYVWIDGRTGVARAVMDGEALIFRKTAADSGLGSKLLAREDVKTMLMIGAGALAPYLIEAHRVARPSIEKVVIWNRTRQNAEKMASDLRREQQIEAIVIDDLRLGLGQADIVSSATMTSTPLVLGRALKPGSHIDLVGSFTPAMRESDDDLLRRAKVYVDSYGTTERSGDFLDPVGRGVFSLDEIVGDMYGLVSGTIVRRQSEDEITLMKNGGGSHLDYFTAREVMKRWKSE